MKTIIKCSILKTELGIDMNKMATGQSNTKLEYEHKDNWNMSTQIIWLVS